MYQIVKEDGTIELAELVEGDGMLGQDNGNGDGNGTPAPAPSPTQTIRFRFPFQPFYTFPLVARYHYPPPYRVQPRPRFPVRATLFARSMSFYNTPVGYVPVGIIEVDSIETALEIARCMDGGIGPVGAVAPTQLPGEPGFRPYGYY